MAEPLTEEELAALKSEVWHAIWAGRDEDIAAEAERALDRLIADLRAAQKRIKELEDGIEAYLSGQNPL